MAASEEQDHNERVIAEFRANEGRLSGPFEGAPVLLLHHTGARSGVERVNPVMYQAVGDSYAVFASSAGRERNPAWYHNLLANPDTEIEVGTSTIPVHARVTGAAEREPIWATQKERYPGFADYEARTDRTIPVLLLELRT